MREAEPERQVQVVIHTRLSAVGDRVLLRAVLANLFGNAWKFTSKPTSARIEIGIETGETIFFVKDNGAGFGNEGIAEKLFLAPSKGCTVKTTSPVPAVGLATVQRIVARHGGQIWVEGHPNQSATFVLHASGELIWSASRSDSVPGSRDKAVPFAIHRFKPPNFCLI